MFNMKKSFALSIFSLINICAFSQSLSSYIKGHLSGSFENNSQYYYQDDKIGAFRPQDKYASNSFLKLDYNYDKFTAGLQFESYMPPILGYFPLPVENGNKIINKYFKYTDKKFSVQVGDFYEQFGSGMILRAFENRQIGINNALEGVNVHAEPFNFMKLKVVYGRSRKILEYSNTVTRGLDAEISLNEIFAKGKDSKTDVFLSGSYVGKYQEYTGPVDNFPSTVEAYSGRLDLNADNFSFNTEYVEKGSDPNLLNGMSFNKGKAFLMNTSFTVKNMGISLTARSLYNMNFNAERDLEFTSITPINYLPALTKQQDYLTSNIYVYNTQVKGEIGYQADAFYHFKPGTALGGKYGTKFAINISGFNGVKDSSNIFSATDQKYYRDANLEIKKKWSKKLETTLSLQHLFYNTSVIQAATHPDVIADIVALGAVYKFAPKKSIRIKAEHLTTKQDQGNWAAALAEFSFSSPYAFYVTDLYNYVESDIHYYNFGGSVTRNSTRFSLAFGKQRAGLFCVGGVCRFVPASYGFSASLTTSFGN